MMPDEYSEATYKAWCDLSASIKRRERDWLRGFAPHWPRSHPPGGITYLSRRELTNLLIQQQNAQRPLDTGLTYRGTGMFGGIFGQAIGL